MTQAEAILLSLLGPKPVFWRNPKFPDILAAWNGMCMTQNHALMIAGEIFWEQNPTPEMKSVADRRFLFLYHAGAFEDCRSWQPVVDQHAPQGNMHLWYRRKLKPFLDRNLINQQPSKVFEWFNFADWAQEKAKFA